MRSSRVAIVAVTIAIIVLWSSLSVLAGTTGKKVFAYYQLPSIGPAADESLKICKHVLTDLSPCSIEITDGYGKLEVLPGGTSFFGILEGSDMAVAPLIRNYNFDNRIAHWALLSPSAQRKMVASVLEILEKEPRYSGLVVDIENIWGEDRRDFSDFMRRLAEGLHPKGYKLYVAAMPKETDEPKKGWRPSGFDYAELGKYTDGVLLMTYNLHWRTGKPGPVSPIDWVERVTKFALSCMPAEKVIVGIPFYGFDWPIGAPGKSVTYGKASALRAQVKAELQWDEVSATPWFAYTKDGVKHEVWFEDARSIQAKLDMCKRLGVGGINVWRLGDEDPQFWDMIGKYSKGE